MSCDNGTPCIMKIQQAWLYAPIWSFLPKNSIFGSVKRPAKMASKLIIVYGNTTVFLRILKLFYLNDLRFSRWYRKIKVKIKRRVKNKKKKKIHIREVPPRFELGSLDSESRVLTITPWDQTDTCWLKFRYSNVKLKVDRLVWFDSIYFNSQNGIIHQNSSLITSYLKT